jgi:hypothetical protein
LLHMLVVLCSMYLSFAFVRLLAPLRPKPTHA